MKTLSAVLLLIVGLSTVAFAQVTFAQDEADSTAAAADYSAQRLDVSDSVTLAGEIDIERLANTYPDGVLLIDLRTAAEGVADEQAAAAEAGVNYRNVPVAGAVIDTAALDQLQQLLDGRDPAEHVVIHCASGNRAGMMWGALEVDAGADVSVVLEELAPIATKEPVRAALRDYAGRSEP